VRLKLTIEYVGTRYSGWQIQKNARTIQGELERAIKEVSGTRPLELYGSGRTDAGVHALAQVAHLDVDTTLPSETLRRRVNDALPSDINIVRIERVRHRFHARHDAVARRYVYQIARRRTAFAKAYVWWVKEDLNLASMREVAAQFVGMHDFRSFAAIREADRGASTGLSGRYATRPDDADEKSTAVHLEACDVREEGDLLLVSVEGSHFLWKMVRRLVGVLVEVGRSGLTVQDAASMLTNPSPLPARLTAPASGLFLERVFYPGDRRDVPVQPVLLLPRRP
jgi:tRNA pseudouridine38-40 synthase